MNATPVFSSDFSEGNAGGSDSETNSDDATEHYQPIAAADGDDSDQDNSDSDHYYDNQASRFHDLSNGYRVTGAENGISALQINDEGSEQWSSEEEDRTRESDVTAIRRAIREDENRMTAPLKAENAMTVMEAMRRVLSSFIC